MGFDLDCVGLDRFNITHPPKYGSNQQQMRIEVIKHDKTGGNLDRYFIPLLNTLFFVTVCGDT